MKSFSVGAGNNTAAGHAVTAADLRAANLAKFQSGMLHKVLSDSLTGEMEEHVASLENQGLTEDDGPSCLNSSRLRQGKSNNSTK